MKVKKAIITFLILLCILTIAGCDNTKTANEYIDMSVSVSGGETNENKSVDVTVFFSDEYGYIVPVRTSIPWTEGIAKAVIRKMMNTSELQQELVMMGLESLMPPEATIKGLDITNGLAKIDFKTGELTLETQKAEENFVKGVVLALTSFPTVEEVQFMFNGHVIDTLEHGTDVSKPIGKIDINTATSSAGESVTVYYHATSSTNFEYFVPVTVYMDTANCFNALEYLINTPCENLKTCIPTGTKLLDVNIIGDTLCLFFNDEFNALSESPAMEYSALKSIALTCTSFISSERIKIYAGSSEYIPSDSIDTPTYANVY